MPTIIRASRPWRARAVAASWLLVLAVSTSWSLAYSYTSLGLDVEELRAGRVRCTFYRLRWPGDGSLALARIVEFREAASKPFEALDLGAVFLQEPRPLAAQGFWQRHGFWYVDVAPGAPAPPIVAGASRAVLVGVPHWLLLAICLGCAVALTHGRRASPAPPRQSAADR